MNRQQYSSGHFKSNSDPKKFTKRFSTDLYYNQMNKFDTDQLAHIQSLQTQLAKYRNKNRQANLKIKQLNQNIEYLKQKNNYQTEYQYSELNSPIFMEYSDNNSAQTSKNQSFDIETINQKYNQNIKENQLKQFKQRIQDLEEENQQLKKKILQYQSISMIVQQYKVFQTTMASKQSQLLQLREQIDALKQDVSTKDCKIKELMSEHRIYNQKIQISEIQIDNLRGQMDLILQQNEQLKEQIKKIKFIENQNIMLEQKLFKIKQKQHKINQDVYQRYNKCFSCDIAAQTSIKTQNIQEKADLDDNYHNGQIDERILDYQNIIKQHLGSHQILQESQQYNEQSSIQNQIVQKKVNKQSVLDIFLKKYKICLF